MKKFLMLTLVLLASPILMWADDYQSLWTQVHEAGTKDLPKTQITLLEKIVKQATKQKNYGQLLAAELMAAGLQTQITPDSLQPELDRLLQKAEEAADKDPVRSAVYYASLGKLYQSSISLGENHLTRSQDYFRKALAQPALLAACQDASYRPLVVVGEQSDIFNHDLLHVIGREANDNQTLHDYYEKNGNRPAACLTALWQLQERTHGATYEQQLDSLLAQYGDLPVACEVAWAKYVYLQGKAGVTPTELKAFAETSLNRWREWAGSKQFENAISELTAPAFNADQWKSLALPNRQQMIHLSGIRNVQDITMRVSRVDVAGDTKLNPGQKDDLKTLRNLIAEKDVQVERHTYTGHEDCELFADSLLLKGLPVGAYLVELTGNNGTYVAQPQLLFVSDLQLLVERLPKNELRLVVVNATTGQPVPGATVRMTTNANYNKNEQTHTLTVDGQGECRYTFDNRVPTLYYVYAGTDKYHRESWLSPNYTYYQGQDVVLKTSVFTDRSLYRPGQTVHATVIAHQVKEGVQTSVLANEEVTLTLRDANYKTVHQEKVRTDEYGTATADFTLPTHGLTGSFSVMASGRATGTANIRVEEYKRPTFEVEVPVYEEKYAVGDTVVVTAHAKTYAGMPVQGAKVSYTVVRQQALWWAGLGNNAQTELFTGEAVTDGDGAFQMKMPILLADDEDNGIIRPYWRSARFYNITATALVTDVAGESHEGRITLPIGTKPTVLTCNLPEKSEAGKLSSVTFSYRNAAGKEIDGTVAYSFDGGKQLTAKANQPVKVSLKPGRHVLKAICGTDTLEQQVVVFSMTDKRPVIETPDWFYVSDNEFPQDGSPVYVQVGGSYAPQHIVYSICSGDEVLESGVIDQGNAVKTLRFTYRKEYGSGLSLNYAWVREGEVYEHHATIRRPMPDKRLLTEWKTFRDRLTPGQQEEWTLSVRKPDGSPASAQMMATLFDKSLDQIMKHNWRLDLGMSQNVPSAAWNYTTRSSWFTSYHYPVKYQTVKALDFSALDETYYEAFDGYGGRYRAMPLAKTRMLAMGSAQMKVAAVTESAVAMNDMAMDAGSAKEEEASEVETTSADQSVAPQLRENLQETAFFYPTLLADKNGIVSMKFTLPESITTWRMMGIVHDKDMNNAFVENEVVAQKTVMVQPNVPRFVRQGDKASLAARLFNTSEKDVTGKALIELVDPATEQVVYTETKDYTIKAQGTADVMFTIDAQPALFSEPIYICRVWAKGDGYTDGEQHYLPVLSNEELVTNTVPFTQHQPGIKTIDLTTLFPQNIRSPKLTVEYTNNPAWLMIQALPYIGNVNEKNAISLVSAYYANSIAKSLLTASPAIKTTIDLWKKEAGAETSMMSNLQKNEGLKALLLDETPWVMAAEKESEQKQALIRFFDENAINQTLGQALSKLKELQNANGSWSWWQDMPGSTYMTMSVVETLVRLNLMIGAPETTAMVDQAFGFMDARIAEEVKEMKKLEKKGEKNLHPSEVAVNYLYAIALSGRKLSSVTKANHDYLVKFIAKKTREFTIYGKAVSAVILAKNGYQKKAQDYLQSIREYSVYTEEMGRYFDTRKATYSWCDYKIPTEVAAIEAYQLLMPEDKTIIEEMQRWLLQAKRTQVWDTPINSVNAVYAFLGNQTATIANQLGTSAEQAQMKLDGTALELPRAIAGLGYVKTVATSPDMKTLTVEKTDGNTSWGAVYAQFMQPVTDITDAVSGLTVTREVITRQPSSATLAVGDKVTVRITVKADRDYDFVQVIDKRAACLEPVNQLSGYRNGYYCAPKDYTTAYYFNGLSKGLHTIETEYYVDREGEYQSGTCTAQCAYAPEYMGRTQGTKLMVEKK